jgi:type IV pilus modification protein PilV
VTDAARSQALPGAEGETLALPTGRRPAPDSQAGYTLIEVMIAMVVLIIGVLGTFMLIDGSAASTSRTTAREQGTNLARDLVERSRQLTYAKTTMALAPTNLRAALPASDSAGALTGASLDTFTVTRRNTTYTVKVFACSVDDPTDGAGQGDATFCEAPTGTIGQGPTTPAPGAAASVNVLGVAVVAGGSLLQTVCNAVGTNSAIMNRLTAAVSKVAPISACPSGATSNVAYDNQPDDLRRITATVSWTRAGHADSLVQTTLLTNPRQT